MSHLLLDLLSVDDLVDDRARASRGGSMRPYEEVLIESLLAVDLEFANNADSRRRVDDGELSMGIFVDLLRTDMMMDQGRGEEEARAVGSVATFHDAHKQHRRALSKIDQHNHHIHDDVMLHLLAVDEEVDGGKRYTEHASSYEYALICDMHDVDAEVGGAKARTLVVQDLGCLLDIDRMMDGIRG
jgi:hypothetical protein